MLLVIAFVVVMVEMVVAVTTGQYSCASVGGRSVTMQIVARVSTDTVSMSWRALKLCTKCFNAN